MAMLVITRGYWDDPPSRCCHFLTFSRCHRHQEPGDFERSGGPKGPPMGMGDGEQKSLENVDLPKKNMQNMWI